MVISEDDRIFAMLIYLSSFFTAFIGPLLIWLLKRENSAFVDFHGRHYFNFLISYAIYGVIAGLTIFLIIGIILVPAVSIAAFIFTIIGAIKAFGGEQYRIPLTLVIIPEK